MTTYAESYRKLQQVFREALIKFFDDSMESEEFSGCLYCGMVNVCGEYGLICHNAFVGFAKSELWQPKFSATTVD